MARLPPPQSWTVCQGSDQLPSLVVWNWTRVSKSVEAPEAFSTMRVVRRLASSGAI
jgi:hypothetical protein